MAAIPLMGPRAAVAAALGLAVATAIVARPPKRVALALGDVAGPLLGRGWSVSQRTDLNDEVAALDPESAWIENRFRFRAGANGSVLRLPLVARGGPLRLRMQAMARVRTVVTVHAQGQPAGRLTVARGPWGGHDLELQAAPDDGGLELSFALEARPMVRVPDDYALRPVLWVRRVEVEAPALAFTAAARLQLAAVPLALFAVALAAGADRRHALAASALAAAILVALAGAAPLPLLVATPRLLPIALGAALLTAAALRRDPAVPAAARPGLAALVAAGFLFHGALAFVPGFDPGDLEIHVRRAVDFGSVPLDYGAWLRYGSHLPTPSQTFGEATAALGDEAPIPYSPLPYALYYALHALGVDLRWGMLAANALLAMLVAPWLFAVTARILGAGAAWVAALLYALDLPVWHHVARSHAPAAFGMALAPAALLLLARESAGLGDRRRALLCGALLGLAVLGYSTLVVLAGLFGLVLLALLAADARGLERDARRGLVLALVAGGALAGGLYYFHYLPGLLAARGGPPGPDLFLGRSYLVFHNESRQSMRVWAAGFAVPLAAGLAAAPWALRRASAAARPVLGAWLAAWALTMLLKEPFLFPRPLRWAKEDQFVAPLLAVLIAGGIASLPRPWQRRVAAAVAVAAALWLQLSDYRVHASGLFA